MTARNATVWYVLALIALDILSLGIMIPVLPKLVEDMSGGDTARAAEIFGVFGLAWAVMQFVFSPIHGALSDRFGRRPVLLISSAGLTLDYILMAVAPNLVWLFVGRLISGICAASFSTASAYIADITPAEQRAQRFGLIGAAFGLGFVLGPAVGGLLGETDPRLPFWFAAAFTGAGFVYGLCVLPESLPRDRRSAFKWSKANPLGSLDLLRSNAQLWGLSGVFLLFHLAHAALPAVFVLYASHRYGWTARDVGLSLALVGICSALVQGFLIKPFVARYGERGALVTGLLGGAVGFSIYGLAPNGATALLGIPITTIWGLASTAVQSLSTRLVDPTQQGRLQGANSAIMAIGSIVAPILFTQIFSAAIADGMPVALSGAPYLVGAALLVGAAALGWRVTRTIPA